MTTAVLVHPEAQSPRLRFGIEILTRALADIGIRVEHAASLESLTDPGSSWRILVGARGSSEEIAALERHDVLLYNTGEPGPDGYYLATVPGEITVVTGADDSGVLYGCQELSRVVRETGGIPRDIDRGETPDLVLRGPAIGLQKTKVEPPRQVYEYPINHDRFPWFYDRQLWTDVLDELFSERANVVYLWSGHPFSSFVRLADYPEAQEVTDDEMTANRDLLRWLTAEADRRGIWIVMKFYNIHIPLPFAEHHGIPLYQPAPTPLVSDYTRKSIATFVAEFPNIGLYVCLGEVLQGDIYGTEWFVDTILAGVHDGIADAPQRELPPVIVRAHAIDLRPVLERALEVYPRLFTEAKYNGESLTTWNPRGKWQQTHRLLASLGSLHIVNVHILANLEPFRFGAVSFIQRSVLAMKERLDADGLHLYPLFYWEWPNSPDKAEPRLRQIDRDRMWFAAWHRYAWKADRDPGAEREYWTSVLAARFGSRGAALAALEAYEAVGQIAPRLIRRVGITEGNRQTFSLGMTMSQLTNAPKHRPWADLWESHAPGGERIEEYVERELRGLPHVGETPANVVTETRYFAEQAVRAIERGTADVTTDHDEYRRLRTDVDALALLTQHYGLRITAAIDIMLYREGRIAGLDPSHELLERAADLIDESVAVYRKLVALTEGTYLYANSMQTQQRRVPFPDGERYAHWSACAPLFEAEARNFRRNIGVLEMGTSGRGDRGEELSAPFQPIAVELQTPAAETFTLTPGTSVFAGTDSNIREIAPELKGLTGVRIERDAGYEQQVEISFRLDEPGHVLVGYFQSTAPVWLQVPDLEVDTHADARGGLEPVLRNALAVDFLPPVNIHAFRFEAGSHTLALGRGAYLIAGFVAHNQEFSGRDALGGDADTDTLDWLYEDSTEPDALAPADEQH